LVVVKVDLASLAEPLAQNIFIGLLILWQNAKSYNCQACLIRKNNMFFVLEGRNL